MISVIFEYLNIIFKNFGLFFWGGATHLEELNNRIKKKKNNVINILYNNIKHTQIRMTSRNDLIILKSSAKQ